MKLINLYPILCVILFLSTSQTGCQSTPGTEFETEESELDNEILDEVTPVLDITNPCDAEHFQYNESMNSTDAGYWIIEKENGLETPMLMPNGESISYNITSINILRDKQNQEVVYQFVSSNNPCSPGDANPLCGTQYMHYDCQGNYLNIDGETVSPSTHELLQFIPVE